MWGRGSADAHTGKTVPKAVSLPYSPAATCLALPLTQLFLVSRSVDQQVFLDVLRIQFLVHANKQFLGFGVHVAHIHPTFMVEQDIVPFSGSIDADIELLRLEGEDSTTWGEGTELASPTPVVSFLKP